MKSPGTTSSATRRERWLVGAAMSCCVALLLGIAAISLGASAWLGGALGLAALLLLGLGGGLVVAHLLLDQRAGSTGAETFDQSDVTEVPAQSGVGQGGSTPDDRTRRRTT
jgi:hypothetical protein